MGCCLLLLLVTAVLHAPPSPAQEPPGSSVIRHVSLLTMQHDTVLPDHAVVVEGERITWVGPAAEVQIPSAAVVIDGEGRFLLPGLADMHVHVEGADLPLFLANGVTTVREMNGAPRHVSLRDSIAGGRVTGPHMIVSSTLLAGEEQPWRHELVSDAVAARSAARRARDAGFEALKVYDALPGPAYAALVEASQETGLPLVGHIPRDVGLEGVLSAGQRSIEHTEQIMYATVGHTPDPTRIPGIVSRIAATGTWVVPTLAAQRILTRSGTPAYNARFDAPEMRFVDGGTLAWWRSLAAPEGAPEPEPDDPRRLRAEAFYGFQRDLARALHEAGVPLLVGTDTPNPLLVPGYSIHLELAALVEAGIPPLDVLRMATREAARFMEEDGGWGVVAPGATADLLLVDADPSEDLDTLRRPAGVMVRGQWLDRPALERMLQDRETGGGG